MQILILEKNMKYGIKSLSNKHLFLFTKEKTLYYGFKGANILKFKLITNSLLDVKKKKILTKKSRFQIYGDIDGEINVNISIERYFNIIIFYAK